MMLTNGVEHWEETWPSLAAEITLPTSSKRGNCHQISSGGPINHLLVVLTVYPRNSGPACVIPENRLFNQNARPFEYIFSLLERIFGKINTSGREITELQSRIKITEFYLIFSKLEAFPRNSRIPAHLRIKLIFFSPKYAKLAVFKFKM